MSLIGLRECGYTDLKSWVYGITFVGAGVLLVFEWDGKIYMELWKGVMGSLQAGRRYLK